MREGFPLFSAGRFDMPLGTYMLISHLLLITQMKRTQMIPLVKGRAQPGATEFLRVGDAVIAAGEIPEKLIEFSG